MPRTGPTPCKLKYSSDPSPPVEKISGSVHGDIIIFQSTLDIHNTMAIGPVGGGLRNSTKTTTKKQMESIIRFPKLTLNFLNIYLKFTCK